MTLSYWLQGDALVPPSITAASAEQEGEVLVPLTTRPEGAVVDLTSICPGELRAEDRASTR